MNKCIPIKTDSTLQKVQWQDDSKGKYDPGDLAGRIIRFRFHLSEGELYSFWVSPDQSGASYGYVAAGGPGFTGPVDTVGCSLGKQ